MSVERELELAPFGRVFNLADLEGTNGFTVSGAKRDDNIGRLVSSAGDINGDGFDDFIFSSGYGANPNTYYASAYVVFGTHQRSSQRVELSSLNGQNGFSITSPDRYGTSNYAASISDAGDINGDGLDDLIVGVPSDYAERNGLYSGRSYILFGTRQDFPSTVNLSTLDGRDGFAIDGTNLIGGLGYSVSRAGDINGDGIDDLVVSEDPNKDYSREPGKSYMVFGSAQNFSNAFDLLELDGQNGFSISARGSVSDIGDFNGDGFDDIAIGSKDSEESYILFGKATFTSSVNLPNNNDSVTIRLGDTDDRRNFSYFVSGIGDINGDRLDDLLVSEKSSDKTYVVFGTKENSERNLVLSELDGSNGFAIVNVDNSGTVRPSASRAGDVNGDGVDDIILGATGASANGEATGESYVILGSTEGFNATLSPSELDGSNGFVLRGVESGDYSGFSVSSGGDINGDGRDDLIVGAPSADSNGDRSGEVYVVYGREVSLPTPSPEVEAPLNPVGGGTESDDGIIGTNEADQIEGLIGNDVLSGQAGNDDLDGGEGVDTALYQFDPAGVVVDLLAGVATDGFGDTDRLVGIENVIGSGFNDTITGDDTANSLTGREGDDTLKGGLGDDTLLGGDGFDLLSGGAGSDSFLYLSATEGRDAIANFESGTDKLLLIGAAFGGLSRGTLSTELFFTGVEATSESQRLGYNPDTQEVLFDADGTGSTKAQVLATLSGTPGFSSTDITIL